MLDKMDDDLDLAATNLNFVSSKTRELIQKSGGKKNFMIILVMSLIVVVLLFLIIYT